MESAGPNLLELVVPTTEGPLVKLCWLGLKFRRWLQNTMYSENHGLCWFAGGLMIAPTRKVAREVAPPISPKHLPQVLPERSRCPLGRHCLRVLVSVLYSGLPWNAWFVRYEATVFLCGKGWF